MFYSRQREYHADAGSARLRNDKHAMIAALRKLDMVSGKKKTKQDAFAMLKISGGKTRMNIFRSHPTTKQRIDALEALQLG
jgi:Zn-dependent protease with chaperone function